jgi:stress-induced morphogen
VIGSATSPVSAMFGELEGGVHALAIHASAPDEGGA